MTTITCVTMTHMFAVIVSCSVEQCNIVLCYPVYVIAVQVVEVQFNVVNSNSSPYITRSKVILHSEEKLQSLRPWQETNSRDDLAKLVVWLWKQVAGFD